LQDLIEETLGFIWRKRVIAALSHELFEVILKVLEDEVKLVLRVNYFL
jgi:hypothetical protein